MKVATKRIGHEGTVSTSDRTLMSFDESSIAHIMSVLTDMYSNPTLAVIREYSINGLDSHAAAGVDRPIEVTLPNRFDPNFKVRDYGTGMGRDEIVERYAKYGASSKRGTNAEAGMLGIGCKSALTYTSQFIVKAIMDGESHTVLVTRDESGIGAVQFIESIKSDEPTGVEVTIPVKNIDHFIAVAKEFFTYWVPELVLVNGEHPVPFHASSDVRSLITDFWIVPGAGKDKVIMGNIAYPLDTKQISLQTLGIAANFSAVFNVPIGSVDFAPSREALQYNKRTMATLRDMFEKVKSKSQADIQALVDSAKTPGEAAEAAFAWSKIFPRMTFTWQGKPFPMHYDVTSSDNIRSWTVYASDYTTTSSGINTGYKLTFPVVHAAFNVINFKGSSVTASIKAVLKEQWKDKLTNGQAKTVYLWESTCPFLEYLHPDRVIDLAKFKVKTSSTTRKATPKDKLPNYMYWQSNGTLSKRVAYPSNVDKVLWMVRGYHNNSDIALCVKRLDLEKTPLILISSNQTEKFKRCHPDAVPFGDYMKSLGSTIWQGYSDDQRELALKAPQWLNIIAETYTDGAALDPDLDATLKSLRFTTDVRKQWNATPNMMKWGNPYGPNNYGTKVKPDPPVLAVLEKRFPYAKHAPTGATSERKYVNGQYRYVQTKHSATYVDTVLEYTNALHLYRESKKASCTATTS